MLHCNGTHTHMYQSPAWLCAPRTQLRPHAAPITHESTPTTTDVLEIWPVGVLTTASARPRIRLARPAQRFLHGVTKAHMQHDLMYHDINVSRHCGSSSWRRSRWRGWRQFGVKAALQKRLVSRAVALDVRERCASGQYCRASLSAPSRTGA